MPETNSTPVLERNTSKKINKFRPLQLLIKIDEKKIMELPFGWGDGEPPTPDEEEVKVEKKQSK